MEAILGEVQTFQNDGPSQEDLQAATEQERRTKETNLQENGWWVTQLRYSYQYGHDPHLLIDTGPMERVTAETVQRDARLWLRLDNYVQVSLFPEVGGG